MEEKIYNSIQVKAPELWRQTKAYELQNENCDSSKPKGLGTITEEGDKSDEDSPERDLDDLASEPSDTEEQYSQDDDEDEETRAQAR